MQGKQSNINNDVRVFYKQLVSAGTKAFSLFCVQNKLLQRRYSSGREARQTPLHRRGGIEMETPRRRGKHLSAMTKTACHLSDTWTVPVPAGNVTLYPGSLLHSLSSCQCCRFIVTLYQIVINMESLVVQHEMCSAT